MDRYADYTRPTAEVIRRFDVVAIQEVKRDATEGDKGTSERLAYVYDRRRVTPSGLAGEIVVPPPDGGGHPPEQFDRTPYIAGFRSGGVQFALLSAHIRYGGGPADRTAPDGLLHGALSAGPGDPRGEAT